MRTLAEIYADVPGIECAGRCHGSCGPVPATVAEIAAIEAATHHPFATDKDMTCNVLFAGRCTAYAQRPLLCRLWGVTEGMPCVWGCKPERLLTDAEARALLQEAGREYVLPRLPE